MKNKRIVLRGIEKAVMAAVLGMGCAMFMKVPGGAVHAMAAEEVNLPVVSSTDEGRAQGAVFKQSVKLSDSTGEYAKSERGNFTFELKEDSWVYFTGNYARNNHDGVGSDVAIYSDYGHSNKALEFDFGYWRYKNEDYGFLKKGRYYADVYTEHTNYDDFDGDVCIQGYAIPVSKVMKINKKSKKGITTVSIGDVLGSYGRGMQCINKKVGVNSLHNRRVWKEYASSVKVWVNGSKKAKLLKLKSSGKYTYKVKKNGKYTFMIEDSKGSRYQKTVKIKVKK
ncbi:hypothetical protein [Butyrivibrio sp. AC2005]|uniref:hypothetical protein n=1 Tax=Butyrivibrio sp. AC2005 TaxID=1280672 RepID=UPI000410203C|nr:hypothetical protein [Butyrivibrio sp. AC2005]